MRRAQRILVYSSGGSISENEISRIASRWPSRKIFGMDNGMRWMCIHVLALNPERVVVFDSNHKSSRLKLMLVGKVWPVTVYNENLDSFDMDRTHNVVIQRFYGKVNVVNVIMRKYVFTTIVIRAGVRWGLGAVRRKNDWNS